MAKAFVFPGQGSQFPGMCKDLYDAHKEAREMFRQADSLLGFSLSTETDQSDPTGGVPALSCSSTSDDD